MAFPEEDPELPGDLPPATDGINEPNPPEIPETTPEELFPEVVAIESFKMDDAKLKAVLEAIIYVTDVPLSLDQICAAIEQPRDRVI